MAQPNPSTQPWQLPANATYNFQDAAFLQGGVSLGTTPSGSFLSSNAFRMWFLGTMGLLVLSDFLPAVAAGIAAVIFFEAAVYAASEAMQGKGA